MLYSKTSPRIIIKEFHALADCDSPEFELARDTKAFIFELPTAEPQYGVIFEFGSLSSMLYRVDQVSLRGHDNLPHLFSRVRRPAILQSRGRGRRRAILQSHRRNANDPPLYEEVSRSPNEAAQPPSYDEALRWLEMGAPPSYGSLNVDAPNP
ncbi:hypothetical protein FOL47_010486 [Perkinsus chesapeaki]|uniref:Uncharacterized protein n=1 Tax=Perkinsus chesapeaki TaxID=330153 RepID=A0A7J6L2Y6_PERCH|nr:hypothetical protein FOL47_010486 [Perkinsus chesapeaki]